MMRIEAPFLLLPTQGAARALGKFLGHAGRAAFREIVATRQGLEIAHLQFLFLNLTLATCSRIRPDGLVEIELALGDPRLSTRRFTQAQLKSAHAKSLAQKRTLPSPRRP